MITARKLLALAGAAIVVVVLVASLQTMYDRSNDTTEVIGASGCFARSYIALEAQSVPTAQLIPCVVNDLEGWTIVEESFGNGGSTITAAASDTGAVTWTLRLDGSCPTGGAASAPDASSPTTALAESSGGSVEDRRSTSAGIITRTRWYAVDGGCVTSEVVVPERYDEQRVFNEVDSSLRFLPRAEIDAFVRARNDGAFGLDPS